MVSAEVAGLPEGEKLSVDRYTELAVDALRRYRQEIHMPVSAEDENGEMKDFQEVRRPFMNQEGGVHST